MISACIQPLTVRLSDNRLASLNCRGAIGSTDEVSVCVQPLDIRLLDNMLLELDCRVVIGSGGECVCTAPRCAAHTHAIRCGGGDTYGSEDDRQETPY